MTDRNVFDTLREDPFEKPDFDAYGAPVEDQPEDCEHGLSAWLCAGPMHYPQDH